MRIEKDLLQKKRNKTKTIRFQTKDGDNEGDLFHEKGTLHM